MQGLTVIIKGAGDLATGVAHRLTCCGFSVIMLEIPLPTVIRRAVSFAEAIYENEHTVEGVTARMAQSPQEIEKILQMGKVAVVVDPQWLEIKNLEPFIVVDAILAKKNLGTNVKEAPIVIGLGPGFTAGFDVHAVIETKRGHDLGKVLYSGTAYPDTGIPGEINGYGLERLLRSPSEGIFRGMMNIGDFVNIGDLVAMVDETPVFAEISGVLRGILHNGITVTKGFKIGDIDPRQDRLNCFTISDKARSVAGGVLEAILYFLTKGDCLWKETSGHHSRKSVQKI